NCNHLLMPTYVSNRLYRGITLRFAVYNIFDRGTNEGNDCPVKIQREGVYGILNSVSMLV
ncbi:hypothetical protein ACJX0J_016138, partial [Zea mays]